ncbi:MAG: hypothetical protein ACM3P0_20230 [Acidobacteriota bacterium]
MRGLLVPVIAVLMLTGSIVSYGEQDARINLKQLVQNQIAQIRARGTKQEAPSVNEKAPVQETAAMTLQGKENAGNENATLSETKPFIEKDSREKRVFSEEKGSLKSTSSKSGDGLFLKIFILIDLSLLAALFVYWRRRKLKIGVAEKAKFKKNITKLRSEDRFQRRAKTQSDELRKRLQMDPVLEVEDEATLRRHARKISVPQGELMLASRIRSLEKAHE